MSTKPKSFIHRTVCPGCGWIAPVEINVVDIRQCRECEYEVNVEPFRMETIGEILKSEEWHYNDVALGKFLRSVFELAGVYVKKPVANNDPAKTCEWFDGNHECGKPAKFEWMLSSIDVPLCDEHGGIVAKHQGWSGLRKITDNSVDGQPSAPAQDPR